MSHYILIADDIINYIKEDIEELGGHEVKYVESEKECLKEIKIKKPDILILNSFKLNVLRKLKKKMNDIYVILSTVVRFDEDELSELGVNAYIQKPVSPETFLKEIKKGVDNL